MKDRAQAVLKDCILHEKEGMDFYLKAAKSVESQSARKAFEVLAQEEISHIKSLYQVYEGGEIGELEDFLKSPPSIESEIIKDLEASVDRETNDRRALELALRLEEDNRDNYRKFAAETDDPDVQEVFERLALEEDRHYQVVESEYAHLMGMVHETDMDIYVRE